MNVADIEKGAVLLSEKERFEDIKRFLSLKCSGRDEIKYKSDEGYFIDIITGFDDHFFENIKKLCIERVGYEIRDIDIKIKKL